MCSGRSSAWASIEGGDQIRCTEVQGVCAWNPHGGHVGQAGEHRDALDVHERIAGSGDEQGRHVEVANPFEGREFRHRLEQPQPL